MGLIIRRRTCMDTGVFRTFMRNLIFGRVAVSRHLTIRVITESVYAETLIFRIRGTWENRYLTRLNYFTRWEISKFHAQEAFSQTVQTLLPPYLKIQVPCR